LKDIHLVLGFTGFGFTDNNTQRSKVYIELYHCLPSILLTAVTMLCGWGVAAASHAWA